MLLLQCLDLLLIYLCDFSNPALLGSMIFQLILMVGVLSASHYLTLFARVRLSFLAQTFACSCLTFAGVYVTVSLYVPEAYEIDLQSNFTQKPEASDHYAKQIAIMVRKLSLKTLARQHQMAQQPGVQSRTSALMVKDVHIDICITPFEDRVMVRAA